MHKQSVVGSCGLGPSKTACDSFTRGPLGQFERILSCHHMQQPPAVCSTKACRQCCSDHNYTIMMHARLWEMHCLQARASRSEAAADPGSGDPQASASGRHDRLQTTLASTSSLSKIKYRLQLPPAHNVRADRNVLRDPWMETLSERGLSYLSVAWDAQSLVPTGFRSDLPFALALPSSNGFIPALLH